MFQRNSLGKLGRNLGRVLWEILVENPGGIIEGKGILDKDTHHPPLNLAQLINNFHTLIEQKLYCLIYEKTVFKCKPTEIVSAHRSFSVHRADHRVYQITHCSRCLQRHSFSLVVNHTTDHNWILICFVSFVCLLDMFSPPITTT